jgi:O-glycosyl hydrolase
MWQTPIFLIVMMVVVWPVPIVHAADHADVVDLGTTHQVIENFGASDAWTMQGVGTWSEAAKNKVADLLFDKEHGIGLSLWRFNIGGGTNRISINKADRTPETFEVAEGKYDWNRQASERWFCEAARDRGVPYLLGFVNSPPGRMTRNGLTNSGDDKTSPSNLKPGYEKQFARYLCDIVQHFRDEPDRSRRLLFNYLSPVNEPQIDWGRGSQEGSRNDNEQIRRIIIALHEELVARHLPTKVRAPESNTVPDLWRLDERASKQWGLPYGNYMSLLLGDESIAPMIDHTVCYHDYSSASGPSVEKDHQRLGEKLSAYPGAKVWMSEICIMSRKRDLGIHMALQVATLIHADLALSNASAWHWWLAMSNGDYKDGLLYTDWHHPGDSESIITSKSLWAMGNYSRFIRPGMVRVELKGDHHRFDGLLGSAYIDPSSHRLVMVYINLAKESQTVRWSLQGGNTSVVKLVPYVTSQTKELEAQPVLTINQAAEIPAESVVTFVEQRP